MTKEEAIEIVKSAFSAWESEFRVPNDDWSEEHEALDMAIEALKADRPRGEWIDTEFLKLKECSSCHCRWGMYDVEDFDFCPNCGAKMDRGGDAE